MHTKIIIRSILVSFLVAVPSPFVITWISSIFTQSANAVIFCSVYILAFIGCLAMGCCGRRDVESEPDQRAETAFNQTNDREIGVVKWFNRSKGFGFITRETGEDVFVHFRSIRQGGKRTLNDGQKVKFRVSTGQKGLQAEEVSVVK